MKQWINMGEEENNKIKREEQERLNKLKENHLFLKEQMQGIKIHKKQSALSKSPLRGTMNEDEIQLNRQLLMEISAKKKERFITSGGQSNYNSNNISKHIALGVNGNNIYNNK